MGLSGYPGQDVSPPEVTTPFMASPHDTGDLGYLRTLYLFLLEAVCGPEHSLIP